MSKEMRKPYYILGSETDNLNIKLSTRNEASISFDNYHHTCTTRTISPVPLPSNSLYL